MTYCEEYSRIVDRMRIVDPQCKEKCSREKILENFDWCMENCQVIAEDHNLPRDALWVARRWLEEIARRFNVDPKYVYELDPYLEKIRLVRHGDIILPEDHNSIVEALRKLREILEKIEGLVYKEGYEEGYEKGYEEGYEKGYNEGVAYCLENLVPVKAELVLPAYFYVPADVGKELKAESVFLPRLQVDAKVRVYTEISITVKS